MREDIHDLSYQDEEGPPPKLEYVWRNIILMGLLHVGILYGITLVPSSKVYTCLFGLQSAANAGQDVFGLNQCVCYIFFSGLGVTAWAHRPWSHRTYKARLPLRLFLIIDNTMAFWNDHYTHHKFSETHNNPHNFRHSFFFSLVGWPLLCKHPAVKEKGGKLDMSDLKAEKRVMFQRRYYKSGILLMCFVLPTLVPWYCWGETFLHSFYVATLLRYTLVFSATWLVNSATHFYGYHPYGKNTDTQENVLTSEGMLGEGFHNYHHAFPYDYSASEYRWHINFTTFFIDCMAALGLAYDLKRVFKASVLARVKRTGEENCKND